MPDGLQGKNGGISHQKVAHALMAQSVQAADLYRVVSKPCERDWLDRSVVSREAAHGRDFFTSKLLCERTRLLVRFGHN